MLDFINWAIQFDGGPFECKKEAAGNLAKRNRRSLAKAECTGSTSNFKLQVYF